MRNEQALGAAIGARLCRARRRSGTTQSELADMTGMAQGDISAIENGNRNVTIKTLRRLADALGVHVEVTFNDGVCDYPMTAGIW